jgi:hypothetical protein
MKCKKTVLACLIDADANGASAYLMAAYSGCYNRQEDTARGTSPEANMPPSGVCSCHVGQADAMVIAVAVM